jgi:xanthine/uracil permease
MNAKKIISTLLLVAGIAALIFFLMVDRLGMGEYPGYGFKQIAGMVIGAVVAVIGLVLKYRK